MTVDSSENGARESKSQLKLFASGVFEKKFQNSKSLVAP